MCDEILPCWNVNVFAALVLATEIATVALDARCVAFTVRAAGFTAVVLEKAAARAGHSGSCTGHAAAGLGGTPSVISQAVVHVI